MRLADTQRSNRRISLILPMFFPCEMFPVSALPHHLKRNQLNKRKTCAQDRYSLPYTFFNVSYVSEAFLPNIEHNLLFALYLMAIFRHTMKLDLQIECQKKSTSTSNLMCLKLKHWFRVEIALYFWVVSSEMCIYFQKT